MERISPNAPNRSFVDDSCLFEQLRFHPPRSHRVEILNQKERTAVMINN